MFRTLHRHSMFFVAFCALLLVFACKQTQPAPAPGPSDPGPATIDKEKLCSDGGATFNAGVNACECPGDLMWNGTRCIPQPDTPEDNEDDAERKLCEDQDGTWSGDDCDCGANKWWTGKRCLENDPEDFSWEQVRDVCKAGGGTWDRDQLICACDGTKVLSDGLCVELTNGLTRSVCEDAVFPGRWQDDLCGCEDDDYAFSAARGGCVPEQDDADEDTLETICASSVNDGEWDSTKERCECPDGQIWFRENCPDQSDLSSREVCEGAFNKGVWSNSEKNCQCPVATMWIDQTCKDIKDISEQVACESEFNGGRWSIATPPGTCLCPQGKGWLPNVKRCDVGGVSAAQQLCIQSGGTPSSNEGTCTCGSGFKVQTLAPQNFQYCVRTDSTDDVPVWLLILLGIMEG